MIINTFDIPKDVSAIMNIAMENHLISIEDVIFLTSKFSNDWKSIIETILDWGYADENRDNYIRKIHDIYVTSNIYYTKPSFDSAFNNFFEGCKKIYVEYMDEVFPNNPKEEFTFKKNRKYTKVIRGNSVHCFVDNETGDVLKAASWNAPAKHARGNIFDDDNGLANMMEYGPAHFKKGRKSNK